MRLDLRSTATQQADIQVIAGCAVVFASNPALSTTYALDQTTLDEIKAVANDSANGLGLPLGADYFSYPDKGGAPRMFDATEIQALYVALRDYFTLLSYYQAGQISVLPEQPITIP